MTEKLLVPDIGDFENVEVIELLVKEGHTFIGHKFDGKYLDCGTMNGYIKSSLEISKI